MVTLHHCEVLNFTLIKVKRIECLCNIWQMKWAEFKEAELRTLSHGYLKGNAAIPSWTAAPGLKY